MIPEVSPNGHTAVPLSTLITELYGDHQSATTSQHQATTSPTPDLEAITRPERQAFRAAVAEVAEKAKATLPECTGRVDKAVALVLAGDVTTQPDGSALVGSQCAPDVSYHVIGGRCVCKDFPQAPHQFCKHRLALSIQHRALALMTTHAPAPVAAVRQLPPPLPEAPASVNCHVTIAGRQVQVTLRDTDETRLLTRLTALLALYPVPDVATVTTQAPQRPPAPPEGWCHVHQLQMPKNTKEGRSWYSHRREDGSWCKGK
jgi:hypothetical protein